MVVYGLCLVTLPWTINETLKMAHNDALAHNDACLNAEIILAVTV